MYFSFASSCLKIPIPFGKRIWIWIAMIPVEVYSGT